MWIGSASAEIFSVFEWQGLWTKRFATLAIDSRHKRPNEDQATRSWLVPPSSLYNRSCENLPAANSILVVTELKGQNWIFLLALFLLLFVRKYWIQFLLRPDVRITWPSHISYLSGGAFISLRFWWEAAPCKYTVNNMLSTYLNPKLWNSHEPDACCWTLIGFESQSDYPFTCGWEAVYILWVPCCWRKDLLTLSDVTCFTQSWQLWHSPQKPDQSQFRLWYSNFHANNSYDWPMNRGMWEFTGFNRLAFCSYRKFN